MQKNGLYQRIYRRRSEREALEELREKEEQKNAFIEAISHEIEDRLRVINGRTAALLEEKLPDSARIKVQEIQTVERDIQNIANDILDFLKLDRDEITLKEQNYNPAEVFKDVMDIAAKERRGKQIELIVDCEPLMPRELYGDAEKIRRILECLVRNAVQYTREGGIILRAFTRKESYGVNLCIQVIDTGIGMSPEQLDLLFTKEAYKSNAKLHTVSGLGIELVIARRFIAAMQGFISAKSAVGAGSEFQVVLPQKVIDGTPAVSLETKDMRFLCYTDQEKYKYNPIREGYIEAIDNMARQLEVPIDFCRNLAEVKRKIERVRYSHVFISGDEYQEEENYFEALADEMPVVLILNEEAKEGKSEQFILLYKPFYISDVLCALKKQQKMAQERGVHRWIDEKIGISYCGGNRNDYLEVLQIYLDFSEKAIPLLEENYKSRNWKEYTTQVHSLKGSSLGIGAAALFELAKEQEAAARACDEEQIRKRHEKMMQRYREVLKEIAECLEEKDEERL